MQTKTTMTLLALLIASATLAKGECGMDKPFKIRVQRSFHSGKVAVPKARCKTSQSPCTVSGTIFMVSTKKVSYAILLLDGIEGKLAVGESYSAFLLCQEHPIMIPENNDGKPIAAFYVLEQRARPHEGYTAAKSASLDARSSVKSAGPNSSPAKRG
jgi:hypothetical protein